MTKCKLEVCVDNIESVKTADSTGIDRIELCSSLALGGLSPTLSLLNYINKAECKAEIHAMVRPRPGNFFYTDEEIENSIAEIENMSAFKISGIVFGALMKDGRIDLNSSEIVINAANKFNLEATFHRAIDLTQDYELSVQQIIELGYTRILTSGGCDNVEKGRYNLESMQKKYGGKIQIMAGGGVKPANINMLIESGLQNIHCSASTLKKDSTKFKLGQNSGDLSYQVTDLKTLKEIKDLLA